MSAGEVRTPIRRILVALDASPASLAALQAAAAIAARTDADLFGLYVEDVNLLHLAGLPFAAEIGLLSGRRPLTPEEMERHLRAQGIRAEQALAQAAERLRVRCSFRVTRGQIVPELLTAALEADLVALGAMSTQVIRRTWLGSTAQAVIAQATRPLLILPRGARVHAPIAVVCADTPGSLQALALAAYVNARLDEGELVVLLIADDADAEERLRQSAAAQLASMEGGVRYRWLVDADINELARVLRAERVATLALTNDIAALDAQAIRRLLERMDIAVLLARGGAG